MSDPDQDLAQAYDEDYYSGKGADPMVDYVFELERPAESIRVLEWSGILGIVEGVRPVDEGLRWLDYGCGNGGLVRWVAQKTRAAVFGAEDGWVADRARAHGIPVLSTTAAQSHGPYDVITAIEVLEHIADPGPFVEQIAGLLAPGGVFFYTTGNARPHRELAEWGYVVPEVHVSFYEPRTMEMLLRRVGLEAVPLGWSRGYSDVVTYKILKNLHVLRWRGVLRALPWGVISRFVDSRYGVSAFPAGRKPGGELP